MILKWRDLNTANTSFIISNYDRSLEHFLFTALKHTYNKIDEEVSDAVGKNTHHSCAWFSWPLPWQHENGNAYSPLNPIHCPLGSYGKKMTTVVNNIVVVSEANPASEIFPEANKKIFTAKRIYFLRFGYLSQNLERLGLTREKIADNELFSHTRNPGKLVTMLGTSKGLGQAQMSQIPNKWGIMVAR